MDLREPDAPCLFLEIAKSAIMAARSKIFWRSICTLYPVSRQILIHLSIELCKNLNFFCICDAHASSICNLKTSSAILPSMHSALNCQIQMQINRDITINSEYYYGMERRGDKPQHPDYSLPGKINSHLTNILEEWSKSSLMVLVWGRSPDSD